MFERNKGRLLIFFLFVYSVIVLCFVPNDGGEKCGNEDLIFGNATKDPWKNISPVHASSKMICLGKIILCQGNADEFILSCVTIM